MTLYSLAMRNARLTIAGAVLLAASAAANAVCVYDGVDNAKTTVAQEFGDSRWVVRVRLMAADSHWSDEDESYTVYHVKTVQSFKGRAPARLNVFTYRDSGGFFLDKGVFADLGGEYLLFLKPARRTLPRGARGALEVNYSCGQSATWMKINRRQREVLAALGK